MVTSDATKKVNDEEHQMEKLDAMKMCQVEGPGTTRKGTKRLFATGLVLVGMAVSSCTATATPTYNPPGAGL